MTFISSFTFLKYPSNMWCVGSCHFAMSVYAYVNTFLLLSWWCSFPLLRNLVFMNDISISPLSEVAAPAIHIVTGSWGRGNIHIWDLHLGLKPHMRIPENMCMILDFGWKNNNWKYPCGAAPRPQRRLWDRVWFPDQNVNPLFWRAGRIWKMCSFKKNRTFSWR